MDIEDAFNLVEKEILAKYNHKNLGNNIVKKQAGFGQLSFISFRSARCTLSFAISCSKFIENRKIYSDSYTDQPKTFDISYLKLPLFLDANDSKICPSFPAIGNATELKAIDCLS